MVIEMSWQVNEEVSRDMTSEADGKNPGVDSKETRWCMSEWAICDFQWRDGWWTRKGDNRWGAGTARGLNRDQIVKIARLTGCKNFVGKRKKLNTHYRIVLVGVAQLHNLLNYGTGILYAQLAGRFYAYAAENGRQRLLKTVNWIFSKNCKNCCFITMCKPHSKVTHIKQQKYFDHLKGRGYKKDCVLYPRPLRL